MALASLMLAACGNQEDHPYEPVSDANAPTIASLMQQGYLNVDYYPVGCEVPGEPETACDGTGAVFMDNRKFPEEYYADTAEEWGQYQFVCPAISGVEIESWKCREQEMTNG